MTYTNYDLSKINEKHRQSVVDMLAVKQLSDEQIAKIYDLYVELNKHPEEEWEQVGREFWQSNGG